MTEAEREFLSVVGWWAELKATGKVVASAVLGPPETTTSVTWRSDLPIVTDGPYLEAKETVGGFVLLDVESVAEAIEIAGSWPYRRGIRIEVRPVQAI